MVKMMEEKSMNCLHLYQLLSTLRKQGHIIFYSVEVVVMEIRIVVETNRRSSHKVDNRNLTSCSTPPPPDSHTDKQRVCSVVTEDCRVCIMMITEPSAVKGDLKAET